MIGKTRTILRLAALVAAVNAFGRLLGFVRDLVIAQYFGATAATDSFMVSWTISESVSTLIMEGAMVVVLVPLFARELELTGTLRGFVSRSLLPVVAVLLALSSITALLAVWIVKLLAPGLEDPQLATQLVRITALTVFFMGLAGYLTAALNARQIFGIPAAVFAAYNVGILASIFLLRDQLDIYSAAVGLVIGSALMVAVQIPSFIRHAGLPILSFSVDRILLYELAVFVPVGVFTLGRQAQVYVERFLGSFLEAGSISHLNYASKIGQVPMSLAVTVAIVTFPIVARAAASDRPLELGQVLERDLRLIGILVLPAAVVLTVMPYDAVSLLFERGAFSAEDTEATASILRIYSLGLLAQTLVWPAVRPFFTASGGPWVPTRAAALGLLVTIGVSAALLASLGPIGLATGNAAGITVMAGVLIWDLGVRVPGFDAWRLYGFFLRASLAAGVAVACTLPLTLLPGVTPGSALLRLALGGSVAFVSYLAAGRALGLREFGELQGALMRVLRAGRSS